MENNTQQQEDKEFEVWMEGFSVTGNSECAQKLVNIVHPEGKWRGKDFKEACLRAITVLDYDLINYNETHNTFWGCRFFDNEVDARKSFG